MTAETDDLAGLLEACTPGPWDIEEHSIALADVWMRDETMIAENARIDDARLIAMAPDLAREVLSLRADNARLRAVGWRAEDMARQRWGDIQPPMHKAEEIAADAWWELAETLRAALAAREAGPEGGAA